MLSSQLLDRMVSYSQGQLSLSELESWIAPRLRHFFDEADSTEGDIVATLESLIIEHRDGLITESELRSEISEISEQQRTVHLSTPSREQAFSTVSGSNPSTYRQSLYSVSREPSPGSNTIVLDVEG